MALLLADALKISPSDYSKMVAASVITADQLLMSLPAKPINGLAYVYNRENALATTAGVDVDGTIAESATTYTQTTATLRTIAGDVDIDQRLQTAGSNITDQRGKQLVSKVRSLGRTLGQMAITGTDTATSFAGLQSLVTAGQTRLSTGANGDDLLSSSGETAFQILDQLIDQLLLLKVGRIAFFCNGAIKGKLLSAFRLKNYQVETTRIPTTLPAGLADAIGYVDQGVPFYRGIPILQTDWIPSTEAKGTGTTLSSIYLASLDDEAGVCGVYAPVPQDENVVVPGFAGVERVGLVQNKDAVRYRVKSYMAMACHSDKALARASQLITA